MADNSAEKKLGDDFVRWPPLRPGSKLDFPDVAKAPVKLSPLSVEARRTGRERLTGRVAAIIDNHLEGETAGMLAAEILDELYGEID